MAIEITSARKPVYVSPADADPRLIDCEVQIAGRDDWLPFTASPNDVEQHGRDLHAGILRGEYGPIADYVPPPEPEPSPDDSNEEPE